MDRECFAKEVEACTGLMYRVAYTILQNDDDCQDAVQDALLKAWSKLNSRGKINTSAHGSQEY